MITLDKVKINTRIEYLGWNARNFKQSKPFHVSVIHNQHSASISFTSKILLDDYPSMINRDNIVRCLERVKEISSIPLDIDRILQDSTIVYCDFTKDVTLGNMEGLDNDFRKLKNLLVLTNSNNQKYPCSAYRNGNVYINKPVRTKQSKYRITFYDKSRELSRRENSDFLALVNNPQYLTDYFQDKVRIEANAYTEQIKRWLQIDDNSISTVLNATANPLRNAMQEVFVPINVSEDRIPQRNQDRLALLKGLDWDMTAIEANVREHDPNNWSRQIRPYRELCLKYSPYLNHIPTLDVSNWV